MPEVAELTQSSAPDAQPQAETPEAPLSIKDHAAQFGPEGMREAEEDAADDGEPDGDPATPHHSAQQKRDKENQQFRPGKVRHRAKSQQASPEDVPRIQALTAKHRAAEERAAALEAELTRYRQTPQPQTPQQTPPQAQPQARTQDQGDPEPQDTDEKYADNYALYLSDRARWAARDELRRYETARHHQQIQQRAAQAFSERVVKARAKYQDFDTVAFGPMPPIQPGSVVDTFIREDDNGADLLYHLQSQPQERDEILQLPPFQQAKRLTLLSQRFSSPSPEAADLNGAAPSAKPVVLPPKPPTPLRTEAQRVSTPPPTDGSLSVNEHLKQFGKTLLR